VRYGAGARRLGTPTSAGSAPPAGLPLLSLWLGCEAPTVLLELISVSQLRNLHLTETPSSGDDGALYILSEAQSMSHLEALTIAWPQLCCRDWRAQMKHQFKIIKHLSSLRTLSLSMSAEEPYDDLYECTPICYSRSVTPSDFQRFPGSRPYMHVFSEYLADMIAEVLLGMRSLQCFQLKHSPVLPKALKQLCDSFQQMHWLQRIDLTSCCISDACAEYLGQGIQGMGGLRELVMRHNDIHGRGVCVIAEVLWTLPRLAVLDLSFNPFGHEALEVLKKGVGRTASLREVKVECTCMGDEDIVALEGVIAKRDALSSGSSCCGFHSEAS
jgi:Leucine Rich repeat